MPEPTPPDKAARKSTPVGTPDTVNNKLTGPAGSLDAAQQGNALPDRVGRFRIKSLLGEGAFARVYLGVDPELEREVAIKVPKVEELTPEFRESFLRENRLAAIIQHPNICPVYEVGTDGGFPYIVMRVVPGTLSGLLKRLAAPMPPKSAAAVARKLALGLVAAHAQKVVHRDLKPANVLYDEANREVLIADFGLARFADQATEASNGVPKGTPAYMSPEQARGRADEIGTLSDIYSLGVMLYEMLTGKVPFTGSVWEVMRDHCETTPPLPSQVRLGVDPELDAIVLKAMAKHPADRYSSAKAFAQALADYLMLAERGGSAPLFALPPDGEKPKRPSAPAFEVIAKESTKNPAKESNKNAAKESSKNPAKESSKKAPAEPKPVPKPVAVVTVDDEEEDEDDDAPPEKAKKPKGRRAKDKKKGGLPVAAWVGIGTACAAVVVLVVVVIAGKNKPDPGAAPAKPPIATGPSETEREAAKREAEKKEIARLANERETTRLANERKRLQAEEDFKRGENFYSGINGAPPDYAKAREWYELAGTQGHAGAQYTLGQMYAAGRGGVQDDTKAREWYEKAAAQNHASAQNNLGVVYYNGRGVPRDYAKAREWYEKAANQNHATAQSNLGSLYSNGSGVPRDYTKAREWYEKAANQNHAPAQRSLGLIYELGRDVPPNLTTALTWYRKAAAQGDEEAKKAVARLEKGN